MRTVGDIVGDNLHDGLKCFVGGVDFILYLVYDNTVSLCDSIRSVLPLKVVLESSESDIMVITDFLG